MSGSLSASPGRFLSSPDFPGEPRETHQQEICPCILFFNIHSFGVRKSKLCLWVKFMRNSMFFLQIQLLWTCSLISAVVLYWSSVGSYLDSDLSLPSPYHPELLFCTALSASCSVMSDSCDPMDWTRQAPLSVGFSRQEYWCGLPFPSPGDLPNPGIKPRSPALQADSLPSEPPGKPTKPAVKMVVPN